MEEQAYLRLIELLGAELRSSGSADLANPDLYVRDDEESGERRLLPPRKRLIEMLRAFERRVAVSDGANFYLALDRINERLVEGKVENAVIIPAGEQGEGEPLSMSEMPNFGDLAGDLDRLIGGLVQTRDRGEGEPA